jgi:signal transduction histidine kinase
LGWVRPAPWFSRRAGLGVGLLGVVLADEVQQRPGWLVLGQVVVALVMTWLLTVRQATPLPVDPLLLGVSLGVAVSAGRLFLLERVPPSADLQSSVPPMLGLLMLLYVTMAVLLVRNPHLPGWASARLAVVVFALGAGQVLTYPVPHDDARSIVAIGLAVFGTVLLTVTSVELVRNALERQREAEWQVDRLEARLRRDRTLLHEVASGVAGINAASRLLAIPFGLADAERHRLQELLDAESARVDRLMARSGDDPLVDIDLDVLISDVLLAQGIRGRLVAWHPTGHHVRARADDLVEALHLLIDNAALHSGGDSIEVVARKRGDAVEVTVADNGHGIPADVLPTVMEWGARGRASHGGGIGLNEARRLAVGMGGRLDLASEDGVGTRATLTLHAAAEEATDDPVAR